MSNNYFLFTSQELLTGETFSTLQGRLQAVYESVRDQEVPVTMLHYDLHLNNIFINEDGAVGGFDPVSEQDGRSTTTWPKS